MCEKMRDFNNEEQKSYNKIVKNMSEEVAVITLEEYESLRKDSRLLKILFEFGLEEWKFFDDAINVFNNANDK